MKKKSPIDIRVRRTKDPLAETKVAPSQVRALKKAAIEMGVTQSKSIKRR